jgi:hypothetical protein
MERIDVNDFQKIFTDFLKEEFALSRQCFLSGDVIRLELPTNDYYDIQLSTCDTPAKILRWVYLLLQKRWFTIAINRRFIELACDAHGLELSKLHN